MVRRMCGLFALVALLTTLLAPGVTAAEKKSDKDTVDNYLLKAGYPSEIIDSLPPDAKLDLFESQATYVTHKTIKSRLVDKDDEQTPVESNPGDATTMTLESYNFSADLVVSDVADSTWGRVEYKLTYNWDWNYDPFWTLTDKFGMAWTDDFDSMPETYKWGYTAYGRRTANYQTYYTTANFGGTGSTNSSPSTGIGWEYDITGSFYTDEGYFTAQWFTYRHAGWGSTHITKWSNKSRLYESTSAVGRYFHNEVQLQTEFSYNGDMPSIALSPMTDISYSNDYPERWDWLNYNY